MVLSNPAREHASKSAPDKFLTGHCKYQILLSLPRVASSLFSNCSLSWSSWASLADLRYFIMPSRSCFFFHPVPGARPT